MAVSKGLLSVSLSQDQSCFCCGLESGLSIYNVQPLARLSHLDFASVGGVGHAELLGRSNIIAIVGGGQAPKFPHQNVMIWDDLQGKFVYEIAFGSPVLSIKFRKDKLIVVLLTEIHVFNFPAPLERLTTLSTQPNSRGLCAVCPSNDCQLIVYPGPQQGSIQITDLVSIVSPQRAVTDKVCQAHQHEIACCTINQTGTLLGTASIKGTLVRIHSTHTRLLLAEFRRGADPANISCINFSTDSSFLCVASDKGTVHIFAVEEQTLNRKSSFAQVGLTQISKTVGTYVDSQWDLAHFSLPSETSCLCAFLPNTKSVIAICQDGTFHKYSFNTEGDCLRESYDVFLDIGNIDL